MLQQRLDSVPNAKHPLLKLAKYREKESEIERKKKHWNNTHIQIHDTRIKKGKRRHKMTSNDSAYFHVRNWFAVFTTLLLQFHLFYSTRFRYFFFYSSFSSPVGSISSGSITNLSPIEYRFVTVQINIFNDGDG